MIKKLFMKKKKKESGQMIVEYVVLFSVVCGVAVLVATTIFRDNLTNMYTNITTIFDNIRPTMGP